MDAMKFELTKKQKEVFLDLLALGYQIISKDGTEEHCKDYDSVIEKIFSQSLQSSGMDPVTKNKIGVSIAEHRQNVSKSLNEYIRKEFFHAAAKLLAEYKYPVKDYRCEADDYTRQCIAEDLCLKELEEKGMAALRIDIPEIEDSVEKEFNAEEKGRKELEAIWVKANEKYMEAIAKRIEELLEVNHLTEEELCEKSGVAFSVLTGILTGKVKEFNAQILNSFCKIFKISLWQFYQKESFDGIETEFFHSAPIKK